MLLFVHCHVSLSPDRRASLCTFFYKSRRTENRGLEASGYPLPAGIFNGDSRLCPGVFTQQIVRHLLQTMGSLFPNIVETRSADVDDNHFHPNYFPKGYKWQSPDLLRSEIAYGLAKEAFEMDGRKIFDATIGGKCEVFEKIDYEVLF